MWKKELRNNKIIAVALNLVALVPALILGEGTALLLTIPLGLALFFARENWVAL